MLGSPCYSMPAWAEADGCTSSIRRTSRSLERLGHMRGVAWSKTRPGRLRAATSWPPCGRCSTAPVC
jgi:hypothetical protein